MLGCAVTSDQSAYCCTGCLDLDLSTVPLYIRIFVHQTEESTHVVAAGDCAAGAAGAAGAVGAVGVSRITAIRTCRITAITGTGSCNDLPLNGIVGGTIR